MKGGCVMDETKELLRAIMGRLEEMNAELKGLRGEVKELQHEVSSFHGDTNERLEKIEERMDYLAAKWMEHDEEIHKIKRRQA
jgi:predicted nuclease with TOPRIM domain